MTRVEEDEARRRASKREIILAETVRTYERYTTSGYDARWIENRASFDQMAIERDALLVGAIGDVRSKTILDLGCGRGQLALTLERVSGRPDRYVGVDLLPARIAIARERVPWGEFHVASGDRLPLADASVDVVAAVTLFSSIPDPWFRREIARDIERVLRAGGRIVSYDIRYPSPRNPAVAGIGINDFRAMFPGWSVAGRSVTVLPPLARSILGRGARRYRALSRIPILRSHVLAVITRA